MPAPQQIPWQEEGVSALRAVIALVFGALVGWQRQHAGQEAGIRTFAAVALGACVFSLIAPDGDTRIAGQVVTGIGFLGAGVIIRGRAHVHGLTTAASLWATASIGAEIAYGRYITGATVTILLIGILAVSTKSREKRNDPAKQLKPFHSVSARSKSSEGALSQETTNK